MKFSFTNAGLSMGDNAIREVCKKLHLIKSASKLNTYIVIITLLLMATSSQAVDKFWTGASGNNWATAGNWNPSGVPGSGDDVFINNTANAPVIFSGTNATISTIRGSQNSLTVNAGASLTVNTVSINKDAFRINAFSLTNHGTISVNNNVNGMGIVIEGSGGIISNSGTINLNTFLMAIFVAAPSSTTFTNSGNINILNGLGLVHVENAILQFNNQGTLASTSNDQVILMNNGCTLTNSGTISAAGQSFITQGGGSINNQNCGRIIGTHINGVYSLDAGSFTNLGLFQNAGPLHIFGTFTNGSTGVLKYNGLNGSINSNSGAVIVNNFPNNSNIFSYTGTFSGTVNGIFTNAAGTNSAGTFTAPNTFVPSGLPAGSQTLYARITPSGGGCVYVVPFPYILSSPPTFTTHPAPRTVCAGTNTSFNVVASSATSYQWQVNTGSGFTNLSNGGSYSNVTTTTLSISPALSTMNGYLYRCVATGSGGSTNSNSASLTVSTQPTTANAGPDQTGSATCGLTQVTLAGNLPSIGTGQWSIVSGTGGSFANASNRNTTFNGTAGNTYTLRWTISNSPCTASTDDVIITFNRNPTTANAGPDQTGSATCGLTQVTLAGNLPSIGTGQWSIVSGTGGSFANASNRNTTFNGTAGNTYTLRWTISNSPCTSSTDDVIITFNQNPTTANAGPNQTGSATCGLTQVTMAANTPVVGNGQWSIVSGTGGSFGNSSSPLSTFSGIAGNTYSLRWTITNSFCTSVSNVSVTFNVNPIMNCPSNLSVEDIDPPFALSGGSPAGGIYSGPGVSADVFDPTVAGLGVHPILYTYTSPQGCTNSCTFTVTVVPSCTVYSWYLDADNDGYYTGVEILQCDSPGTGYKTTGLLGGGDCNDNNPDIHPGAIEICDGIDNNCNGQIDEGVQTIFYADVDGDGFGDPVNTTLACSLPAGYVSNNTDCNDNDALERPGQVWYKDSDNDGYAQTGAAALTQCLRPVGYKVSAELISITGDCDDNNATIHPAATEICDGIDNNCNGQIDEGVLITYYADVDGDGFGDPSNTTLACSVPAGYVTDNTDCNDNDPLERPGQVWYKDTDNDGYAQTGAAALTQCLRPLGYKVSAELISITGDCDDNNAAIHPAATEICDGIDNNCNGQIDEGVLITYYADVDGDGFGDPSNTTLACSVPAGYVSDNTDCNDNDALERPGQVWYKDSDNDGYAQTGAAALTQCLRPVGYKVSAELISITGDCDDNNPAIHPGATEICDGIDNNCNGQIDEGVQTTYYADVDGDGFGDPGNPTLACSVPEGYVTNNTDCNDNNGLEFPGQVWYADLDDDGYSSGITLIQCARPAGHKLPFELTGGITGDCDDQNPEIYPGAEEICNGLDDDCNGIIDDIGGSTQGNWYNDDIGNAFGSAAFPPCEAEPADTFYIQSYGFGQSNSDTRHMVYQTLCGDMSISARVIQIEGGGWAGITLQENLNPGSRKASLKTQFTNMIFREVRMSQGAVHSMQMLPRPQQTWLKLERIGNTFNGYSSQNGINWTFAFTASIPMNTCIHIGLFTESVNNSTQTSVAIDQVKIASEQNQARPVNYPSAAAANPAITGLEVEAYPNPVNEWLQVRLNHMAPISGQIQVLGLLGELLKEVHVDDMRISDTVIDVSDLPSGIYLLRVTSAENEVITKRIIKQ